jgi:acyl-CoA synthetase
LSPDGWFRSGDLCTLDEQGRLHINGRIKEILIRGGVNISLREIEDAVAGCPGIRDWAACGWPDERLGERICLCVVPEAGKEPELKDIKSYLEDKGVAKRLWPEHVEYLEAIPRTESGKVQRGTLAEELKKRLDGNL